LVEPGDRNISDHTPLLLNTGASTHLTGNRPFKFERGWLVRDGFYDMVANIWQSESLGSTPLERWQFKIRRLRQHLRGWARHTAGSYKKEKKTLLSLLDNLDKKVETDQLSDQEVNLKHYLKERLVTLLREEQLKWYDRAKVKTLLKEMLTLDSSIYSQMVNIENNESLNLRMIKVLLWEMIASSAILLTTIKIFLGNQRLLGFP
jgi:hypothetical protein